LSRILITGAHGALGSYVKEQLQQQHPSAEIGTIVRDQRQANSATDYVCDFLNLDRVKEILSDFRPERAILCAWQTAHGIYWTDPANRAWADATIQFAETFARLGGRFLTFAGTCAEYSWSSEKLIEDETPEMPDTIYGREKLRTTRRLLRLRDEGLLDVNCSRIFFPFCERENEARVTSLAVKALVEGRHFHLRAGDVYRDICHTAHVAKCIVQMTLSGTGGLFNIATGRPTHLGRFVAEIANAMGRPDLVSWDRWDDNAHPKNEPRSLFGSNERVRPYFCPPLDLADDIRAFVRARTAQFRRS
jgi:nucleoside-diphosphate-sugar epimerase